MHIDGTAVLTESALLGQAGRSLVECGCGRAGEGIEVSTLVLGLLTG